MTKRERDGAGSRGARRGGGPVWGVNGSTRPRGQVHRRQRARGVMRPRQLEGGVSLMGGGGLGRVSGRGLERPRPRPAGSRLRNLAGLFPPRRGVRPPARPGAPRWASPPPAPHPPQALVPRLPPCPCPSPQSRSGRRRERRGGTGATTRRAKRARGRAASERRARAQQDLMRASRAGLSRLRRQLCGRPLPPAAPPTTNQTGPQSRPVPPPAKSHWTSRKWRFVEPSGGGASSARGTGPAPPRAFAAPPAAGTRSSGPDDLGAARGPESRLGVPRPPWPQLPHLPNRADDPHEVV